MKEGGKRGGHAEGRAGTARVADVGGDADVH